MNSRPTHKLATAAAELPKRVAPGRGADCQAAIPPERAKVLRLELSRAARVAREFSGMTQQQLATRAGVSRAIVRLWEDSAETTAPSLRHLAIAPADWALPLFQYALRMHGYDAVRLPDEAADVAHIEAEVRRACINALRALESGGEAHKRDAYRRLLECARMGLAVRA